MLRRTVVVGLILTVAAVPAQAQWTVFDPSNFAQTVLIAQRTQRQAATMNMQLTTWRDGRAANDALVRGTGDALRTWRQP